MCTSVGDANASRYSTSLCIPTYTYLLYTRVSSRNSAVHFYYLPFYGRKSLPHADSRCAEGRRAIAREEGGGEGLVKKTNRIRLPRTPRRRRRRYAYVSLILASCTRRESSPLVKRKCGRYIIAQRCNILGECDLSSQIIKYTIIKVTVKMHILSFFLTFTRYLQFDFCFT